MMLLYGILCGIALSLFFSFGPAFFSLIQTSIQHGYRRAWPFPFGIFASDCVVVFLMLTVLKNADMFAIIHNPYVAVIGGVAMIVIGVITMRKKVKEPKNTKSANVKFRTTKSSPWGLFFNGFLVNFLNPLIWVFWIAVIALFTGELDMQPAERYVFFAGLLGATLSLDLVKCKLASLLQKSITARVLNIFNKCTAVIFFAFGAYLIISMLVFQLDPVARQRQLEKDKDPRSTQMIKRIGEGLHDSSTFHIGK